MQPPKISNRFRRKAGEKAVAARRDRAKTKELVASGELFFLELFNDDRKSIARMKLIDLLQSVPGVGKIRAEQILERASISPSRRIGGVGPRQIELLRKEFLLMKNSPRAGKLLVVSGIRPGEVNGIDYHFVNDDEFNEMIKADEFLEFAEFAGARYGTPRKAVDKALAAGKNVILEIELKGARQVRKSSKDAIMIFIEPPSWEVLKTRLSNRGTESEFSTQARLDRAKEELSAASEFDHVLVNHEVEQSVSELVSLALR